jgi:hypothetical protein
VNTKRAVRVAGAGLVATGVFLAALLVLGATVFFGLLDFSPGADTGVRWAVTLVVLALIAVGGALPAHALGAGWRRSLATSGVTMVALALVAPSLLSNAEELFLLFYLFAFVAPAFIAATASVGNGLSFTGLVSMAAVAALFFLVPRLTGWILLPGVDETSVALVEGVAMVAAGWALLPALAGLFQRRPDEAE